MSRSLTFLTPVHPEYGRPTTRARRFAAPLIALALAACTGGDAAPSTTVSVPSSLPSEAPDPGPDDPPATVVEPAVVADFGVNLESGAISVAAVGASGAALAGHLAYWEALAVETGGVGGELLVDVIEVESVAELAGVDVIGVSLDRGPVVAVEEDLFAMAPRQTIDALAAGRTLDVTRPSLGQVIGAASELAADDAFEGAGELGVAAGASCPFDPMTYQLTAGSEAPFVLVCGTPAEAAALLPEIAGVVLLSGDAWDPGLFSGFEGYVVGARPEPGPEVPGVALLAAAALDTPWDPAFVDGYTAALTAHLVLERAYAAGDLTRAAVADVADALAEDVPDVGFGPPDAVRVAVVDPESPSGLRTVQVLQP